MILFEYIPQSLQLDIANITCICNYLTVDAIIIPANPISKYYPDSISCAALLKSVISRFGIDSLEHKNVGLLSNLRTSNLVFIPTIKTSNYTEESLQSAFLTLKYANLRAVAIVSGDINPTSSDITTNDALLLLDKLSRQDNYFCELQVFCAIDSNITENTLESFRKKISFGIKDFITQPFYEINTSHHTSINDNFSISQPINYQFFLKYMNNYIDSILRLDSNQIRFYCGFLPLMKERIAININKKKIGIFIPTSYIKNIALDALNANLDIFNSLKGYNCSISYVNFDDARVFLESVGNSIIEDKT
ncbi:hypothetical protein LS73_003625 [Helicobacter muridarum]|uniref:Methylenetetrahydrofolate reductase (NAD(P)H) n=1 Tax=Helicobacter muridarum TaxID=216 RepID=A0A099U018_9HELI|nr:hypothetical protein [Helicobacter muridarum]TLE00752.1 hypothetical protein LS73_003625 [Helicobacter muridarum]STQ86568.1 Uncharacterised protein [Helicobacter muridarum]